MSFHGRLVSTGPRCPLGHALDWLCVGWMEAAWITNNIFLFLFYVLLYFSLSIYLYFSPYLSSLFTVSIFFIFFSILSFLFSLSNLLYFSLSLVNFSLCLYFIFRYFICLSLYFIFLSTLGGTRVLFFHVSSL